MASGVENFSCLNSFFLAAGGGEVPSPEAFFGRSPVSGDRKMTQAKGTGSHVG